MVVHYLINKNDVLRLAQQVNAATVNNNNNGGSGAKINNNNGVMKFSLSSLNSAPIKLQLHPIWLQIQVESTLQYHGLLIHLCQKHNQL